MARQLYFLERKTGEEDGHFDVSSYGEGQIETIKRGMRINIGPGWMVCDSETRPPVGGVEMSK